jgi:hypothetical protein
MESSNKSAFDDIIEKRIIDVKLQKLSYVKVKITFHHIDKTTKTIMYLST